MERRRSEVMTVHPDGKGVTRLTHTHGNKAQLAWSPDGERLLLTSSRRGFKDDTLYTRGPQPYGEIFAMNCDGTHVEQLTDDQWEEGGPPGNVTLRPRCRHRRLENNRIAKVPIKVLSPACWRPHFGGVKKATFDTGPRALRFTHTCV